MNILHKPTLQLPKTQISLREENNAKVTQRVTQILLEKVARTKCCARLIKLRIALV